MKHDRMCSYKKCHDPACSTSDERHIHGCICELIAKVRADEQFKAWFRVIKLCAHTKHVGSKPCIHDVCGDAARGLSS